MKIAGIIAIVLILIYAVLAMVQLWTDGIDPETFIKLTITFVIVIVTTVTIALIRREYINDAIMRKNGQIG